MVLIMDDAADERFLKRKFDTTENHGQSENLSVGRLMKKPKIYNLDCADIDYVMYLKRRKILNPYDPPHEFPVEDSDPVEDGDDPEYALFLSRLKKDGSSYILEADERIGLIKPLKYEEDESDDVGQEDMNSPSKTQSTELIDGDYAFFSKNLIYSGSNVIFQHHSSQFAVYDGQDLPNFRIDNAAYFRKEMSKLSSHEKKSSYSSEEDRYSRRGNQQGRKRSKFRAKIMRILSKPYDKEEHQKLWQDITVQKPQLKHIDLRSGGVRFTASEKMGKSYLEHHGDLKRKVKAAAKDDCKQLNLLRGFFFWIQNLTQEGSFIPWNDEECIAARPKAS